jgi:hypothetical protein
VQFAGPRNEHSKALPPEPTEAYGVRYVAGSAPGTATKLGEAYWNGTRDL